MCCINDFVRPTRIFLRNVGTYRSFLKVIKKHKIPLSLDFSSHSYTKTCIVLGSEQPDVDCGPYKSATIALAVIAFVSIVINVILMIYLLRQLRMKKKG